MRGVFGVGAASPPRPLHRGIGKKQIGLRRLTLWFACVLPLLTGSASSHDASSYGGVFRSRDLGAAWLNADVGLFLNAALVIAVDPRDSSHLLVGTDLGILSSHNGGRSWVPEARDVIIGAVFALAFSPDGEKAMCAAASGLFRRDQDGWLRAEAPESAIPARALVAGPANDRVYLLGRSRLFASEDGGRTYAVVPGLPQMSEMTALVAIPGSADILAAVIDGRAMISHDGGRSWRNAGFGEAAAPVGIQSDVRCLRREPECAASPPARTQRPWWSPPIAESIAARTAVKPGRRKKTTFRPISRPGLSPAIRTMRASSTRSFRWCPMRKSGAWPSKAATCWRASNRSALPAGSRFVCWC